MTRSVGVQVVQIGKEATPGVGGVATRRLGSMNIDLKPEADTSEFRPKGSKYVTVVAENKAWASGKADGQPTYEEVIYPLASVFTKPVSTQTMDGATPTGAYTHVFSPASSGADDPQTFVVEQGDATLAVRSALAVFTDFSLDVSRADVKMAGTLVGQRVDTTAVLAAGLVTPSNLTPILPGQVCVYTADIVADLGGITGTGVKLDNVVSLKPSVGKRFDPVWFLNCAINSFSGIVENQDPDAKVELLMEANAEGIAWLGRLTAGTTKFLRIEATGPVIAAKATYPGLAADVRAKFTWDFAVKCTAPGQFSDESGVYAINPSLVVVHDAAWGRATKVTVQNKVATL